MDDPLWQTVEVRLRFHQKAWDASGLDACNRVFRKVLGRCGVAGEPPTLAPETCTIRMEEWSDARRATDLVRTHDRSKPEYDAPPLIAVEHQGRWFAVDGTTRANKWIAEKRPGPHPIIIITPQQ